MMLFACILFNLQFSFFNTAQASAQGTKTVAVKVSNKTQTINNKEYYIHIVEPGQTLFSIARAYGLQVQRITSRLNRARRSTALRASMG